MYDKDIAENPYLNDYGKYAVQFARNHGITVNEAFEHPTVKAYKKFYDASKDMKSIFTTYYGA